MSMKNDKVESFLRLFASPMGKTLTKADIKQIQESELPSVLSEFAISFYSLTSSIESCVEVSSGMSPGSYDEGVHSLHIPCVKSMLEYYTYLRHIQEIECGNMFVFAEDAIGSGDLYGMDITRSTSMPVYQLYTDMLSSKKVNSLLDVEEGAQLAFDFMASDTGTSFA